MTLMTRGSVNAPVVVVCEPPTGAMEREGCPVGVDSPWFKVFKYAAKEAGFSGKDFYYISCSACVPENCDGSDKRTRDFIDTYKEEFESLLSKTNPELIMYMGKWAGRVVEKKAIQITKARGKVKEVNIAALNRPTKVLPMLGLRFVYMRPENTEIFNTDFSMAGRLKDCGYNTEEVQHSYEGVDYEWCFNLSSLIRNPPKAMAVDTETTGLDWFKAEVECLTVQLTYKAGHSLVIPVHEKFFPDAPKGAIPRVLKQLKKLLENKKIRKIGHNQKYDHHILERCFGIKTKGWVGDTQLLAFIVDENMQNKSLDECVRRWIPDLAGYADAFNETTDKNDMFNVPKDEFLRYAGGDSDATFRLAQVLTPLAKKDKGQWQVYQKVILPAIYTFCNPVEEIGISIDTRKLANLQQELNVLEFTLYAKLIEQVPRALKRKHAEKGLSFSRADFVRDILFSKQGFGFTPVVFTKSTKKLPPNQRIPSTSAKDHLPYFLEYSAFVQQLMDYQRMQKLRSTYVGVPEGVDQKGVEQEATGFWKYIYNGVIHPSFMLHRTVTGRAASSSPNAQNFPKRGKGIMKDLVKAYREIFVARDGYTLIEVDLSQAELRIAAWMAREQNMLLVYKNDGDIHATTAAYIMGLSLKQFYALDPDVIKMKRFQAKAVNFGFIYGMQWRKFMVYAKTDYDLEYTETEAQDIRTAFFTLYPNLLHWHEDVREWVQEHGYVRALHGAKRSLPNIFSDDFLIKGECERQAINAPVQRFASDLGLIAMARFSRDADKEIMRPLAFIHDALVIEVKEEYKDEGVNAAKFYMETPPLQEWFGLTSPVPIKADVSIGRSLSDMEELNLKDYYTPDFYQESLDY